MDAILSRRGFARGLAISLGLATCRTGLAQPAEGAVYVGVETSGLTGKSRAAFFTATGRRTSHVPLDFRAHGLAQHNQTLVVFPRRPGNRFAVVDLTILEVRAVIEAPGHRHFYGHGALSRDGATLLVAENDLDTLQGVIGVYETGTAPRRLGEVALPGAGPHEIIRAEDADAFYIALGGLETHPDYGRTPLNLDSFQSRILSFDLSTGALAPFGTWDTAQGVSLRHLAIDAHGTLFVGGQAMFPSPRAEDVLWKVTPDGVSRVETHGLLQGYVSSVAAHAGKVMVTSKVSGQTVVLENNEVVETTSRDGASGAALGYDLTVSSGYEALSINQHVVPVSALHEFDNHGFVLQSPLF